MTSHTNQLPIIKMSIGYIRVSTEEQFKHGNGLKIQRNEINSYCVKKNIKLLKTFHDDGISGGNDITKRKGLKELFDYIKENKVDNVIVSKMDRIARDVFVHLWIEKELLIYNVTIISIGEENISGNDYMSIAMRQMVTVFAQLEKSRISDRLFEGRKYNTKKGIKSNGCCPFGYYYSYNGKKRDVLIDADKSLIVKEIFDMYLNNFSTRKISNILNDINIKANRNKNWTNKSIQYILKNDFYIGNVNFGTIKSKGNHESIISLETFIKVNEILQQKNNFR